MAAGRFEGYWETSLNPWDMAAGVLLVREAGGVVTDFAGGPVDIYRRHLLATNGRIHEASLRILARGLSSGAAVTPGA